MEQEQTQVAEVAQPREVISNVRGNKGGKLARNKRKKGRSGSPISMFVRGKISGEDYFKKTGQSTRRG